MQNTFNGHINILKNGQREMYKLNDGLVDTPSTEM